VLGADTSEYALYYVDELVVFSKTFDEQLDYLESVFRKLTTAGFTMNQWHAITFASWKRNLESLNVQVRYTAVRHPQSNPSEKCMKEISKFFRIYCSENQKKWA
jgi:hypothetical protein